MKRKVAIQGVEGSFHEEAVRSFYADFQIIPCHTFEQIYKEMDSGRADAAVMAIENTQQFHGLYHVLGGIISPMDGIGPSDLNIDSLVERVGQGGVKEVILALSSTMEGDTTNFYISRRLEKHDVAVSVIARGISVGNELEYTDEVTLGRSILNRTPMKG